MTSSPPPHERQRGRPRVLVIAAPPPLPTTVGGNQRTHLLLRALQRHAEVGLVLLNTPQRLKPHSEELKRDFGLLAVLPTPPPANAAPWAALRRLAPRLADRLAHNARGAGALLRPVPAIARRVRRIAGEFRPDAIVCRYYAAAGLADAASSGVPVLVDVDDHPVAIYTARRDDPALHPAARAVAARHLRLVSREVERIAAATAVHWIASERDRPLLAGHAAQAVTLPNIPFPAGSAIVPKPPAAAEQDSLLVVGSWNFTPNSTGLEWFLREAWPALRRTRPRATLRVVGSRMADAQRDAWSSVEGVEVVGFADSLDAEYARARLTLCTQFTGGGTKIKVLESLAHGRPVVLTPHALRGYEETLKDGESVLVAGTGPAAAEACARIMSDDNLMAAMSATGPEIVERHYSTRTFNASVEEGLRRAGLLPAPQPAHAEPRR